MNTFYTIIFKTHIITVNRFSCTERKVTRQIYENTNDIIMDSKKIILIVIIIAITFGNVYMGKYTLYVLQNTIWNF